MIFDFETLSIDTKAPGDTEAVRTESAEKANLTCEFISPVEKHRGTKKMPCMRRSIF